MKTPKSSKSFQKRGEPPLPSKEPLVKERRRTFYNSSSAYKSNIIKCKLQKMWNGVQNWVISNVIGKPNQQEARKDIVPKEGAETQQAAGRQAIGAQERTRTESQKLSGKQAFGVFFREVRAIQLQRNTPERTQSDFEESRENFLNSIKCNHNEMLTLASYLEQGHGVAKNEELAQKIRKAAEPENYPEFYLELLVFEDEREHVEGLEWLKVMRSTNGNDWEEKLLPSLKAKVEQLTGDKKVKAERKLKELTLLSKHVRKLESENISSTVEFNEKIEEKMKKYRAIVSL